MGNCSIGIMAAVEKDAEVSRQKRHITADETNSAKDSMNCFRGGHIIMLTLTLEDACAVAIQYMVDHGYKMEPGEPEVIRNELEQKCYMGPGSETLSQMIDRVNPREIAFQIENDSLSTWCEEWRIAAFMALRDIIERGKADV